MFCLKVVLGVLDVVFNIVMPWFVFILLCLMASWTYNVVNCVGMAYSLLMCLLLFVLHVVC